MVGRSGQKRTAHRIGQRSLSGLVEIFKKGMIFLALGVYIIRHYISTPQRLKSRISEVFGGRFRWGRPQSYIDGVLDRDGSYLGISPGGFRGSYQLILVQSTVAILSLVSSVSVHDGETGVVNPATLSDQTDLGLFTQPADDGNETEQEGTVEIEDPDGRGVIYARVSSREQARDGTSLEEQVKSLRTVAEERQIEQLVSPIRDDGQSGTNFEREGIQEVARLAACENLDYILANDVSRIGRAAAATIHYLYELREKFGVTVITSWEGELDVTDVEDAIQITLKCLMAQHATEYRSRRAHLSQIEEFKRGNYAVFLPKDLLGYSQTDDGQWIVDSSEADLVGEIFEAFLQADLDRAYRETAEQVDGLKDDLHSDKVKNILQNPIYKGLPTVRTTSPNVDEQEGPLSKLDEELQLINEDVFERAQEKIGRVRELYSTGSAEPDDVDDLVDEFGWKAVFESSPIVKIECPECGESLSKNGQRKLSDRAVHNYLCSECGRQRKFPSREELKRMNVIADNDESG